MLNRFGGTDLHDHFPTCRKDLLRNDKSFRIAFQEATRLFEQGGDAGRIGAIIYLQTAMNFSASFFDDGEVSIGPIAVIMGALADLDNNVVHPILKPRQLANRSQSGSLRSAIKALAVSTADKLHECGHTRPYSDKMVAISLKKKGFKIERNAPVAAATIAAWRTTIRSGDRSAMKKLYESFHSEWPLLIEKAKPKEAQAMLIDDFEDMVRTLQARDAVK